MNIHFLEEAEEEFLQAALYYEKQAKGLGQKFMNEVYQAIEYIVDFPLASAKLTENIRRKLVKRFPFGVLYQINDDKIVIVAVMNLKRKPFYWKNRI